MAMISGVIKTEESVMPMEKKELPERYRELLQSRSLQIKRQIPKITPIQGLGTSTYFQRWLTRDEANNRILIGKF